MTKRKKKVAPVTVSHPHLRTNGEPVRIEVSEDRVDSYVAAGWLTDEPADTHTDPPVPGEATE